MVIVYCWGCGVKSGSVRIILVGFLGGCSIRMGEGGGGGGLLPPPSTSTSVAMAKLDADSAKVMLFPFPFPFPLLFLSPRERLFFGSEPPFPATMLSLLFMLIFS